MSSKSKQRRKKKPSSIVSGHCRISTKKGRGRVGIAMDNILCGEPVFIEPAAAAIVRSRYISEFCARCLSVGAGVHCAGRCGYGRYCSVKCKDEDAPEHSLSCDLLSRDQLKVIAQESRCDVDLLRLVLAGMHCNNVELPKLKTHKEDMIQSEWIKSVGIAMTAIASFVKWTPAMGIDMACRVTVNAHGIQSDDSRNTSVGVGFFPRTSMLNHSCSPTTAFITRGRNLILRSITDISEGQEITYSYIDLYQSRPNRKVQLEQEKLFTCHCVRCTEPIERSDDRYLEYPKCLKSKCNGVIIQKVCSDCNTGLNSDASRKLNSRVSAALKTWASLRKRYDTKDRSVDMINTLVVFLEDCAEIFDPLNEVFFSANSALMNCYDANKDYVNSARCCETIITCLTRICPELHEETASYLSHLSETLSELTKDNTLHPKMLSKYSVRAKQALEQSNMIHSRISKF